jgi:heptosyltransferase II
LKEQGECTSLTPCHEPAISLKNKRVLVRMPNWLGDAVMATAALKDLSEQLNQENGTLTVLAQDHICQLLEHTPLVHEYLSFSRSKEKKQSEAKRIQKIISKNKFDIGLLFTGSFSSAWQFYRAEIPIRIGFSIHFRSLLLTHPQKDLQDANTHLTTTYKRLLLPFGIPESVTAPLLYITEEEKRRALETHLSLGITPNSTIIGINPGAAYGQAKCWPQANFSALSQELINRGNVQLLYFGDRSSNEMITSICQNLQNNAHNLAGKTSLRELLALIGTCHLFITNDSGPMHIANALDVPLIALFGSTNSIKTGPYGSVEHARGVVIQKKVACSPCYLRTCPIDFRCMKKISVEDVLSVVKRYV